ncbi:ubiquitin elongating factor core-domain-containing protein [Amylocarpus encephaloides]|uniref:Ubiquitin elongating factor core-domain-containing protein n=1 Tax=Amylocarpus encephaloides TaxID=45428 RepID=A0A9P7YSF8_9HELO|nr:ubiquitin elongating factor core-domain-containing protein [Amylocarpus encephaloides]
MDNDAQGTPPPPDAPDKEKMDQIRRRRLEKLSGAPTAKTETPLDATTAQASSSKPSTPPAVKTEEAPKSQITITKSTPPSTTPENPFTKLTSRPSSDAPSTSVRQVEAGLLKRLRAESDEQQTAAQAPPKRVSTSAATEDISEYEHRMLGRIFRITLEPGQKVDSQNHKLIFLCNLRSELEEEDAPIKLTKDRLDSAIMEACSTVPGNKSVLDYLLPCWKRTMKELNGLRGYVAGKDAILREAKRLCMSNCIFAMEMPELYGREPNPSTDSLTPYLLFEPAEDRGICPDFLAEAISRFYDDDTVKPMLTKAVTGLSLKLSILTMNDNYKPFINALKQICQFAPLVTAIAEDPLFQMATSAPGIEKHTLLGPFFRISPLQPEVCKDYFVSPNSMDTGHIQTAQESLRLTLHNHQKDLLDIINQFVRASPSAKNRTLDWFAYIVNQNHMRRALRPDPSQLSTDGFLMNVTVVLDGLCEPFMDSMFSKVSRIEVDYFRRRPRVEIKEETKLNADQNASDEFYELEVEGTSNFISEVFFLTLAAHHYGSEATNAAMKQLIKDIKFIKEKLVEFEKERAKLTSNPHELARFDLQLNKYNGILEKSMQMKMAIEGVLLDKAMQTKSLLFMRYVTVWLLRIAAQSDYTPDTTLELPLSPQIPDTFRFLPEYVLEDIVSNFNFILNFVPEVMISAVGDEIITFAITFLTNSDYIKNPYLKAKLVTLLFHGTWPVFHLKKGLLGDSLNGLKFSNDHLLHALMKFYIEVESTGAHTQFYDKFNIRYEIFQVIKTIWSNDIYKQKLALESKTNTEFFLRFVNLLLNDATYVLDEALTKFPKIHDLQIELSNTALPQDEREKKEEELTTAEGQAQSYMQLTNETVSMMKLFTKNLSRSFTMPEIVDRVAAMVDYTLDTIVGPKSKNLKVEDPKKYYFDVKTLLSEFIDIYLNLGVSDRFVAAVARDGRSYKPENFSNASRILGRFNLRSNEDMAAWSKLISRFAKAKALEDQIEGDLGEIPDEFEDPIMAILMEDPVLLPISRQVVDRSTIATHLLSDPKDPFNRTDLKLEDVIPDVALREKIQTWKAEKKRVAREAREDKMDVTEG